MTDANTVSAGLATLGADGWTVVEPTVQPGAAVPIYDAFRDAGERSEESTTGVDYLSVAGEWLTKTMAYNDTLANRTIYDGPCLVAGIEVTTAMSAHASTLDDNGTTRYPIPASRAAGMYPFPGPIQFRDSAVWIPGSLTAGAIVVWYRPMDPAVNY